jgi:hypothetical protein
MPLCDITPPSHPASLSISYPLSAIRGYQSSFLFPLDVLLYHFNLAIANKKPLNSTNGQIKIGGKCKILQFCSDLYRAIWDKGVWPWGDF